MPAHPVLGLSPVIPVEKLVPTLPLLAAHRDGDDAGQEKLGGFAPDQVGVGTQGFAEQVEPDLGLAAVAEGGVLAQ